MQPSNLFYGSMWEVQLRILTGFYIKNYNSAQLNYFIILFHTFDISQKVMSSIMAQEKTLALPDYVKTCKKCWFYFRKKKKKEEFR